MAQPTPPQNFMALACPKCGGINRTWKQTDLPLRDSKYQVAMTWRWLMALVCENCGFIEFYATRDRTMVPPGR